MVEPLGQLVCALESQPAICKAAQGCMQARRWYWRLTATPCQHGVFCALLSFVQEDGSWIQFDDDKMIPRKEEEVLTLCGEPRCGRCSWCCI